MVHSWGTRPPASASRSAGLPARLRAGPAISAEAGSRASVTHDGCAWRRRRLYTDVDEHWTGGGGQGRGEGVPALSVNERVVAMRGPTRFNALPAGAPRRGDTRRVLDGTHPSSATRPEPLHVARPSMVWLLGMGRRPPAVSAAAALAALSQCRGTFNWRSRASCREGSSAFRPYLAYTASTSSGRSPTRGTAPVTDPSARSTPPLPRPPGACSRTVGLRRPAIFAPTFALTATRSWRPHSLWSGWSATALGLHLIAREWSGSELAG